MTLSDKEKLWKSGKVFGEDCQHFGFGTTLGRSGFGALAKIGPVGPDCQGPSPDTNQNNSLAACFPMAPKICAEYQEC
ncbi:hypothetical protein A6P07_01815 [Acidithiobacillus thiooxidans]|uniref:Uncharacterized protein n=1 Tax=Acidithiobacillus thiooxidans TaxID=930 RepID=A0A1C2IL79_ACITH|nr:hypothetical protein A6P07_01815 [Acidithiobacillus thiooxidans]